MDVGVDEPRDKDGVGVVNAVAVGSDVLAGSGLDDLPVLGSEAGVLDDLPRPVYERPTVDVHIVG